MPLTFADIGEENIIKQLSGSPETKKHLESLGFVPGTGILLLSSMGGDLIVKLRESRIAISREMAHKIMI